MASLRQQRPSLDNCLICLKKVGTGDWVKLDIPGAGNCDLLNKQLEQLFIVEKLLNISREWCEDVLVVRQQLSCDKQSGCVKMEGDEEDTGDCEMVLVEERSRRGNFEWFKVCKKCKKTCVEPAWQAYQRLVAAEARIREMRQKVRETMRETILEKRKSKQWCGLNGLGASVEIRKKVFPDLLTGKTTKDPMSLNTINSPIRANPRPRPSYKPDEDIFITPDTPRNSPPPDLEVHTHEDLDWEPPPNLEGDHLDDNNDFFSSPAPPPPKTSFIRRRIPTSTATTALRLIRRVRRRTPRRPPENLKRFLCTQCGCYFLTSSDFSNHLDAHAKSKQNGGGPHDCKQCSYPARTPGELEFHMKNRHNRIRYYRCSKCGIKAKSWKKLRVHVTEKHAHEMTEEELNNPELSLKCPLCSRQFLRPETFVIHKRKMHPELYGADSVEPLGCPECGRKFLSRILLEHHISNDHTERPSNFVCVQCGKGYEFKCRLDEHMFTHTSKVRREFICHLCGVDYSTQGLLTKHYRTVHPGETDAGGVKTEGGANAQEEEFKCRYCELTSPYRLVIKRHLKTHKEESGHKCEKCGNCYMTEHSLKRHVRINHPLVREMVPCPHCLKPFGSMDYMKDHVKNFCRIKNMEQQGQGAETSSTFVLSTTDINICSVVGTSSREQFHGQTGTQMEERGLPETKLYFP